jgi:hypothetical protein
VRFASPKPPNQENVMGADRVPYLLALPEYIRKDVPVFNQDWWLDIVSRSSDYRELKVSRNGKTAGRLAFVEARNRLGLVCGHDPYWSHLGGPILADGMNRFEQAEVLGLLLDQLPRWGSFSFVCDPGLRYADLVRSSFREAGFEYSTQTTYLRSPEEGDALNTRDSKHRGHFKRAAKSLACVDVGASEFVQFFETNLKTKGETSYAPLAMLPHLIEEAMRQGCARAIAAKPNSFGDSAGPGTHPCYDAAIVYLWDSSRCYYWLSTRREALDGEATPKPHPDAVKFLVLKAMEHARAMNLVFDADGVATPGADHLYRNILGLRKEERRDVFQRVHTLERLYRKSRQGFSLSVSPLRQKRILPL